MPNFRKPEDFSESSPEWIYALCSTDLNATTAPDGTTTADRLNSTALGLSYLSNGANDHTLDAAGQNCINIFAKEDDSGYGLGIATFNWDPSNGTSYFDLVNGVTGTKHSGHDDIIITPFDDGWYLCTVVLTSTDTTGNVRLYIADGDGDATTAADASIFLWGAYSNPGSTPTPYLSDSGFTVPSTGSDLASIVYPRDSMPTPEQRFRDFITDSGITQTGDLTRDYRAALHAVAGLSGNDIDYDLHEAFKRYYETL